MKYLKPELLVRCRSLDDDEADKAAGDWEKTIAAYRHRVRTIRPKLPGGVRRLISRFALHDATVLALAFTKRPLFSIRMRLEDLPSRPGDVLELNYLLATGPVGGASFRKTILFEGDDQGLGRILYDEFDLDEQLNFYTHSLLFASGWEVEVRFHKLRVRRLEEVFLPPFKLPEGERTF